jgi:hypothetical protein
MFKAFKAVLWSTTFLVSISVLAQDRRNDADRQQQHGQSRPGTETGRGYETGNHRAYYDSKHRDWHQWSDQDNQSYRRYEEEHHRDNRDFSNSSEREQEQYWNWRHKHPDSH